MLLIIIVKNLTKVIEFIKKDTRILSALCVMDPPYIIDKKE